MADFDGGAVCGRHGAVALGGGSMFNLAFDFMAALSVILLAACFYQVLKIAEENESIDEMAEKEANKDE